MNLFIVILINVCIHDYFIPLHILKRYKFMKNKMKRYNYFFSYGIFVRFEYILNRSIIKNIILIFI